jgi:adenine-specific DNA-methyltransferase
MKLVTQSPKKALKAFLKQKPLRSEIDLFKAHLITLLDKISIIEKSCHDESEEHLKNNIRDFLRDTYYKETNAINTKDKKDLVIHLGKTTDTEVGVIIEAKRPSNINEMLSAANPNKKALHELILYYLDERNKAENIELKHLIVTNIYEWYIIDANYFDKHIYRNTQIKKLYDTKINDKKDNPFFYEEIAKIIQNMDVEIPCVYFDIREYNTILRNDQKEDDRELSALFKVLSPPQLLKIATPNDSNSLNEKFYKELLHIIGLEEAKEGSKNIIRRKIVNRNPASLIETTIDAIITEDSLQRLPDSSVFGDTKEERVFNISLELCLTWINRILFLKLLESQLITYHQGDKAYRFLNTETIHDFDELFKLFHKVLAVNLDDRTDKIKEKFNRIPYLNSSLFEISELENHIIKINSLDNDGQLELINSSILKDPRKNNEKLPTLDYIFKFLDAYDFASEGIEDIQEDNKSIINASVLGKVFEKINGYKDGSIFTPGFITMYMCRQSIRLAVLEKFNDALTENGIKPFDKFEDIKNYTSRLYKTQEVLKANEIINSLHICDPAVGSGHFLVSSLNEIINIKAELGVLADDQGNGINGYEIEIVNDELIITDHEGSIFEYKLLNGKPVNKEIQRLQKTLFHEKQSIIENCLFGVDINPNSVKICRLRLWIELLKNAYYKEDTNFLELETLPNIDINIKCGNSLISRFALDADLSAALKSIKYSIKEYRGFVREYKNAKDRELRRGFLKIIDTIKGDFRMNIDDPFKAKISKARGEVTNLLSELNRKQQWGEKAPKDLIDKLEKATQRLALLEAEKEAIVNNAVYKNAFEWRFEFPEVLNDNGDFEGFDLIIGNPPYFSLTKIQEQSTFFSKAGYKTYSKGGDIYCLFYERGIQILKAQGFLTYITSNSWLRAIYGELLKKYFIEQMQPLTLLNIEDSQVFKEVTVESNIISLQKSKNAVPFFVCNLSDDYLIGSSLSEYFVKNSFEFNLHDNPDWIIGDEQTSRLKHKIEQGSKLLKDFDVTINFGIKTGYNAAFIIDENIKNQLINENPNSAEIIKPILRGRDLKKYNYEFAEQWAICAFPCLNLEIDKYPAILKHLLNFGKKRLEQSGNEGSRKKTSNKWFETQDSISYWKDFEKPKIIWGEISDKPKFAFDEVNHYAEATTFLMTGNDLKYLLAILNSKVSEWYFNQISTTTGMGTNRWKKYKIELLPIKDISEEIKQPIINLVNKVLDSKKNDPAIDTTNLENQIDELVYKLYDLTSDETDFIKGNPKRI